METRNPITLWISQLFLCLAITFVQGGVTDGTNELHQKDNNSIFRLTVIHVNDMHSRIEQVNSVSNKCSKQDAEANKCYGGFPRVKSASRTARFEAEKAGRSVLFLNAGDNYQGTPYYNLFKWRVVTPFVKDMNFDAMTLGNHEFDDGPEGLSPFLHNITTPTLVCNLDFSEEPSLKVPNLKSSMIFNFTNFKVGVVGYLTPDTEIVAKPGKVKFLPEIPEIQKETNKLRKDGANIVIALGHSGYAKDMEIAREVEGIDLVVGGHSHSLLHNGSKPSTEIVVGNYPTVIEQKNGKEVLVVQAYAFTKYLGIINLDYSTDGQLKSYNGNTKLLDSSIEEDIEMLKEIEPWKAEIDKRSLELLGVTKVFLDASENIRKGESNLANFVCDAYIDYYLRKSKTAVNGWTDSAIALTQAGSLRNSIDVSSSGGNLTVVDLITTMPFEDPVCHITIKGKYLLEALEWGIRNLKENAYDYDGAFLHSSGLKVVFDLSKAPGGRVDKVLVRCSECSVPDYFPLELEKDYGIIMTSYLADGGDGFKMFKNHRSSFVMLPDKDSDIVAEYVKRMSPIYPGKEGRITVMHTENQEKKAQKSGAGHQKPFNHFVIFIFSILFYYTFQM